MKRNKTEPWIRHCAGVGLLLAGVAEAQDDVIEQWVLTRIAESSGPIIHLGSSEQIGGPADSACQPAEDQEEVFDGLAWHPATPDRGTEWIEGLFGQPVHATAVEVHESFNPGAITRILVRNLDGQLHEVWSGEDLNTTCPSVLRVDFEPLDFPTNRIRVELNTTLVPGFNQIDAIKLIGMPVADFEPHFTTADTPLGPLPDGVGNLNFWSFTDYDRLGGPFGGTGRC